jgi:hypothetical protein
VPRLIKLWLKAPIEERDDGDGTRRIGGGVVSAVGTKPPHDGRQRGGPALTALRPALVDEDRMSSIARRVAALTRGTARDTLAYPFVPPTDWRRSSRNPRPADQVRFRP